MLYPLHDPSMHRDGGAVLRPSSWLSGGMGFLAFGYVYMAACSTGWVSQLAINKNSRF